VNIVIISQLQQIHVTVALSDELMHEIPFLGVMAQ